MSGTLVVTCAFLSRIFGNNVSHSQPPLHCSWHVFQLFGSVHFYWGGLQKPSFSPAHTKRDVLAGSQVVVVLPEALKNLAAGNLMLVVTDVLPSLGESFGSKKNAGDVILLSLVVVGALCVTPKLFGGSQPGFSERVSI